MKERWKNEKGRGIESKMVKEMMVMKDHEWREERKIER